MPVESGHASEESLATEARIYGDVVGLCVRFKLCTAIQTLGSTDADSRHVSRLGCRFEFDGEYQPKPAATSRRLWPPGVTKYKVYTDARYDRVT